MKTQGTKYLISGYGLWWATAENDTRKEMANDFTALRNYELLHKTLTM
jgi:hypothetical protein